VLDAEFRNQADEALSWVDPEPLAAASVAQVQPRRKKRLLLTKDSTDNAAMTASWSGGGYRERHRTQDAGCCEYGCRASFDVACHWAKPWRRA
jgi:hypothetical protein